MSDAQAGDPGELISAEQASELLDVPADRVNVMVEQGMLEPADSHAVDELRFRRGDVIAARMRGG